MLYISYSKLLQIQINVVVPPYKKGYSTVLFSEKVGWQMEGYVRFGDREKNIEEVCEWHIAFSSRASLTLAHFSC